MDDKVVRLAELVRQAGTVRHVSATEAGRNRFTRVVDRALLWLRRYAGPLHWFGASLMALGFFLYARLLARTSKLISVGTRAWPEFPPGCVLAIWHGSAPSLLGAIAISKPRQQLVIMVTTEPRGDLLAVFFRLLGVEVVRGDWEHHGWPAVKRITERVAAGACAIITPDGGGPRRVARPGALVVAVAAGAPLVVLGAECRPAFTECRKWDQQRTPVPFGEVAICVQAAVLLPEFESAAALESARLELERALDEAHREAAQVLSR